MNLVDGQMFRFDMDEELGDSARVTLPHKEIIDTLQEVFMINLLAAKTDYYTGAGAAGVGT